MANTSAQEWAKRVRRWQRSGLTAREFGQRHGITPKSLSWWKWHLKKRGEVEERTSGDVGAAEPDPAGTAIRFLPVQVVHAELPPEPRPHRLRSAVVEVGLRNGRVVRVSEDVELGWLAELLSVVEADGVPGC